MKRHLPWFVAVVVAGLVALIGMLRLTRDHAPHAHESRSARSASQQAGPVLNREPRTALPETAGRTSAVDWKALLRNDLAGIASQLPDLDTVPLQLPLQRQAIGPTYRHKLIRDASGAVRELWTYEPRTSDGSVFDLPLLSGQAAGTAKGFHWIGRTIVENVFQEGGGARPEEAIAHTLIDILGSAEDGLGTSTDARNVLRATRWQAAAALRRLPLTADQIAFVTSMANSHADDVLRGACAAAVLANRGEEDIASGWMRHERSPRALQAFLVELVRVETVNHFPASSQVTVRREEADSISVSHDGSAWKQSRPVSGPGLFDELIALLGGNLDEAEESKPARTYTEGEGRITIAETPLEDTKSFVIRAIRLRAGPEHVASLVQLIEAEKKLHYRVPLVEALGGSRAPHAVADLARLAVSDSAIVVRKAAMDGLASNPDPSAKPVLERLLWDPDVHIRAHAALDLYHTEHKNNLSSEARKRVIELAESEPGEQTRRFFGTFAHWLQRKP